MSAVETPEAAVSPDVAEENLDERLCAFLVRKGRLKEADLARARRVHEESDGDRLINLLTKLGLVSERDMAESMAELFKLPLLGSKDFPESPPPNVQLSVRFLKQHHIVPVSESDDEVGMLIADPSEHYPLQ
ncbi:MAG TPA: type II secretion system protein GspE, partial [Tahibacter sp.]|nr:type II secretion system protein GspE [Tahibacter sp.]